MATGVEIKGLEPLLRKVQTYSVNIQSDVDGELTTSAKTISNNAKRKAPYSEGLLRGEIVPDTNVKFLKKVVAGAFYSPYVEFGTKKYVKVPTGVEAYAAGFRGKANRGNFEQFVDSIEAWMKRKGIKAATQIDFGGKLKKVRKRSSLSQAIAQRQLARHIALRIMQNGIKPQPFLFPAMDSETPLLIERIKKILAI
jgi:hypothetical protein